MPEDSIITYEALYEILRLEKYKPELQKIDQDFIEKVVRYIREKNISIDSQKLKDSVFAPLSVKKTKKQVENAQKIIKELYEKRESKIIQLALLFSRTKNDMKFVDCLLEQEKRLFEELISTFDKYRENVLYKIIEGRNPNQNEEPKILKIPEEATVDNKTLKIIADIPQFVGENTEIYGPFKEGEIVNLPVKIADLLIQNQRAEENENTENSKEILQAV
jgi:DNA replication initiation complex subunit (GINS family)